LIIYSFFYRHLHILI